MFDRAEQGNLFKRGLITGPFRSLVLLFETGSAGFLPFVAANIGFPVIRRNRHLIRRNRSILRAEQSCSSPEQVPELKAGDNGRFLAIRS